MFWRKPKANLIDVNPAELTALAARLGVERRQFARVRYPERVQVCKLPEIYFMGAKFKVVDLSAGGCCLLDPGDLLGPAVGVETELELHWTTGMELVRTRIVSRVDHRRHLQFANLSLSRQNLLRRFMVMGIRGLSVRKHTPASDFEQSIEARELWSSLQGDGVTIMSEPERLAEVHFQQDCYTISRAAWPLKNNGAVCSRMEFEQIILFLANVPAPSSLLKQLLGLLEGLLIEGVRK